jgi:sugar lactone lactonase YvrE
MFTFQLLAGRQARLGLLALASLCGLALWLAASASASPSFIGSFSMNGTLASTVPKNGDVNPYGVAVVPASTGRLVAGDVLVSNFNNRGNLQGTGTTIVEISPAGDVRVFASLDRRKLGGACPGGLGLTTALVALQSGWVIVGSLPTTDGTSATAQAGCLIVIDRHGKPVETISGALINGPWDMTALDSGSMATLFVTNVLNGTVAASPGTVAGGTVVRIGLTINGKGEPTVGAQTVIGNGFPERTDPAALVVGPTGVGLGSDGTLYVADSVDSSIESIPNALARTGPPAANTLVSSGVNINDPLGLAMAPNGDILTTNGGDGNIVETTPTGAQVAVVTLDSTPAPPALPGSGALFGLAVAPNGSGVYYVDDATNTLNLLH